MKHRTLRSLGAAAVISFIIWPCVSLAQTAGEGGIVAEDGIEFGDLDKKYRQSTFGAHFVEVGVDSATGLFRLLLELPWRRPAQHQWRRDLRSPPPAERRPRSIRGRGARRQATDAALARRARHGADRIDLGLYPRDCRPVVSERAVHRPQCLDRRPAASPQSAASCDEIAMVQDRSDRLLQA